MERKRRNQSVILGKEVRASHQSRCASDVSLGLLKHRSHLVSKCGPFWGILSDKYNVTFFNTLWRGVWVLWRGVWVLWNGVWVFWRGVWVLWGGVWVLWRGVWVLWRGVWVLWRDFCLSALRGCLIALYFQKLSRSFRHLLDNSILLVPPKGLTFHLT